MKILISGGAKTKNIVNAINTKFNSGGIDFIVVPFIEDIEDIFQRGEYFDKAVIIEQSWNHDYTDDNEYNSRSRVNNFALQSSSRSRTGVSYVFLTQDFDTAEAVYEEILPILTQSVVIIKKPKYSVSFFIDLIRLDIDKFSPDIVYKPAPPEEKVVVETIEEPQINFVEQISSEAYLDTQNKDASLLDVGLDFSDSGLDIAGNEEDSLSDSTNDDWSNWGTDEVQDVQPVIDSLDTEETIEDQDTSNEFILNGTKITRVSDSLDELNIGSELGDFDNSELVTDNSQQSMGDFDMSGFDMGDISKQVEPEVEQPNNDNGNSNQVLYRTGNLPDYSAPEGYNEGEQDIGYDQGEGYGQNVDYGQDTEYDQSADYGQTTGYDQYNDYGYDSVNAGGFDYDTPDDSNNSQSEGDNSEYSPELDNFSSSPNSVYNGKSGGFSAFSQVASMVGFGSGKKQSKTTGMSNKQIRATLDAFANRGNSILVTGFGGSGTSTVALNLANVINRVGYNVLLVDLDTRNKTQSYISKDNYDSMEPEDSSLMAAVNSTSGINAHVSIPREGFHLLTMGMATDSEPVDKLLHKDKIGIFMNSARAHHNFVVYDCPFDVVTGFGREFAFMADNIVITIDCSNWGISKAMLSMCNISDDSVQEVLFNQGQILFNRCGSLNKVMRHKIKTAEDITRVMDSKVSSLLGESPELFFQSMHICGCLNEDKAFESCWFERTQYSDTANGGKIFVELLKNIVLKR